MDAAKKTIANMAQQIAQVAIASHQERTGHSPDAATVILNEDTLIITLHGALSPAEQALAKSAEGAAHIQEFHKQLFINSCEPLRQEIKRITGIELRDATAEVETTTGTAGTVVQVFQLAESVPADAWSGLSPVGCS
jgi:uncharacterized protein YbcI